MPKKNLLPYINNTTKHTQEKTKQKQKFYKQIYNTKIIKQSAIYTKNKSEIENVFSSFSVAVVVVGNELS